MIFSNPWQSTSAVRSKQRRPTTSGFAGMGYSSSSPVIEEDKLVQACSAGPPMSPTQGAAVYLSNYCMPVFEVASRQHLRSATRHQLLLIPRYRLSTFGHWAFAEKFEFLCSVTDRQTDRKMTDDRRMAHGIKRM